MSKDEKDVSFVDFCVSCGHYHQEYVANGKRDYHCTLRTDCSCTPSKFVGRSFKKSFS